PELEEQLGLVPAARPPGRDPGRLELLVDGRVARVIGVRERPTPGLLRALLESHVLLVLGLELGDLLAERLDPIVELLQARCALGRSHPAGPLARGRPPLQRPPSPVPPPTAPSTFELQPSTRS